MDASSSNNNKMEAWEQNDHCFADDIFTCIFLKGKFCILFQASNSLKIVPKRPIDHTSPLVQLMALCNTDNKAAWSSVDPELWQQMVSPSNNEIKVESRKEIFDLSVI